MPNSVFYGPKGVQVNDQGGTHATFDSTTGVAEIDATDTNLVAALEAQGAVKVDVEGTEEHLTPGTVQTATTCSALVLRNDSSETVLNVRNEDGLGDIIAGPFTVAASAERVIVFPTALAAPDGVFIDVDSGGLVSAGAGEGFLIP